MTGLANVNIFIFPSKPDKVKNWEGYDQFILRIILTNKENTGHCQYIQKIKTATSTRLQDIEMHLQTYKYIIAQ